MGLEMLPDESRYTVDALKEQWPCREPQLRQLNAVLSVSFPLNKHLRHTMLTPIANLAQSSRPGRIWRASHWKEQHRQIIPRD